MKLRTPLSKAKSVYINLLGFHTDSPVVIFESDDWGSIRMPSKETYNRLLLRGDPVDKNAFLRNDSIESPTDVNALFEVLSKYTDSKGRHPCFTANFAVANPDFDNIHIPDEEYTYEVFTDTYLKYGYEKQAMLDLFAYGIDNHLFVPQLHAREHVNVSRWMSALKKNKPDALLAFNNRMIGVGASFTRDNMFGYMDTLNYDNRIERDIITNSLIEAAAIFKTVFGYESSTFVASCFVWTPRLEKTLHSIGVEMIQTQFRQNICLGRGTSIMIRPYHYTGQRNKYSQFYSLRNCEYEPAYNNDYEHSALNCLQQIETAFHNRKPAIINTHRLNYIGSINDNNRSNGLKGLDFVLKTIISRYPEVEFLSSDELLAILKKSEQ